MRKLTPYYAFRIYFSIKNHFNGKYDLIKYKWNFMNPMKNNFYSWHGYGVFKALTDYKIKNVREWVNICIVLHLNNPASTFDQLLDEYEHWKSESFQWQGHVANMPYKFKEESTNLMVQMFNENMTFDSRFPVWLLDKYLTHKICLETFIIMKQVLKIGLDGDPNYEYLYKSKFEFYETLLNISSEKYRVILEESIIKTKRRMSCNS